MVSNLPGLHVQWPVVTHDGVEQFRYPLYPRKAASGLCGEIVSSCESSLKGVIRLPFLKS